ncbi:YrzE family protein [Herbiconiux sp. CPCC 205763]|uniref:YrzE family protein n=1 Tax=Herbiconiux aconitum TaxID=2970913 RepID=A0ABT2GRD2_9MICO|nr:DUF4190 domain-containing protein [Herbiconiux aconitum]MCS5718686.1 YrzE family protein [Herbiconiux aconitum]
MTNLPPGAGPTDNSDDENNGAVPPVPPVPPLPPVPPVSPPPAGTSGQDAPPPYQPPPAYVPPPAYAEVPPGQVPPGQYGQPPQYGGPPPAAPPGGVNGLAIASIIVGGVAFIGAFIPFLNYAVWFVALVGLVLGIIALVRKGKSKGLAIGGTILSAVALILSIVLAIVYTVGFIGAVNQAVDEGLATITPIPADPLPSDDPFATTEPDEGTDDGTDDGGLGDVIAAQFGQVVTYDDGMEISVSEPTPFTPSGNAVGADQATNLSFTVTIVNGTATDYQPFSFSTVTSGGVEASLIIDPDNGAEGLPPVDTIPAGQTVTYVEAYSVADANDVVFDVAPGFEYTTARFTN